MESQDVGNANDENRYGGYLFHKLPENIRQMGEPPLENRVYIEDYVITYMHQIFQKKQENAIVILVGKRGEKAADHCSFIYGAMEIELNILEGVQNFNSETWDKIYELLYQHFPGAEILGWGCGVSMWNSQVDIAVQQIQNKYFAKEGRILFLADLGEREEKVFCWQQDKLEEQPGYIIYYEKNPQMQDYMLLGQPKKSFEASYEDKVTATVRNIVHGKGVEVSRGKLAMYSVGILLVLLSILGANLLVRSTKKIDSLEKTIETLSNAAVNVTEMPKGKQEKTKKKAETKKDGATAATLPKVPDALQTSVPEGLPAPKATEKSVDVAKVTQKPMVTREPQNSSAAKNTQTVPSSAIPVQTASPALSTPASSAAPSDRVAEAEKRKAASYVVRYGDTLSQIVWRQYHTLSCLEMVKKANKIKDGDKIKEGQVIYLPAYP